MPMLLPVSIVVLAVDVCEPRSVKDLTSSPASKPAPPIPHCMSMYMKKANDLSPSVAKTAWNVFVCAGQKEQPQ